MSFPPAIDLPSLRSGIAVGITVLAIVGDLHSRALFVNVITVPGDRLFLTSNLAEGLALAEAHPPDVAFVEVGMGEGAGLAMVHHLKALVPSVTIFVLATKDELEAASDAVALGGNGLLMMPGSGDEVLSAVATVKAKIADRTLRSDIEQTTALYQRVAGWVARMAELAEAPSRFAAAQRVLEVLIEATGASGAAVYLTDGDKPTDLVRAAVSAGLEDTPAFGRDTEIFDYARRMQLLAVPLTHRSFKAGHVLLADALLADVGPHAGSHGAHGKPGATVLASAPAGRIDGLVKLLSVQATTALALLGAQDRAGGAPMKDPSSSAYSFAFYADVAGREIDKAKRYGRRFAIVTVAFDLGLRSAGDDGSGRPPPLGDEAPALSAAELADQLLKIARDTDVLARVDENEFHLLMPETDGLGAHACRRRIFAILANTSPNGAPSAYGPNTTRPADKRPGALPSGLLVGIATFPHDGQNLSQLLRVARRRADETKTSIVHRIPAESANLADLLEALEWELGTPDAADLGAPRAVEMPVVEAAYLATALVNDALRGGATLLVAANHPGSSLGAGLRSTVGAGRDNVTLHALDVRASQGADVEALAVIAEHGAYAFLGRSQGGVVRGLHSADPLLADLIAERLGKAAGLRIFT